MADQARPPRQWPGPPARRPPAGRPPDDGPTADAPDSSAGSPASADASPAEGADTPEPSSGVTSVDEAVQQVEELLQEDLGALGDITAERDEYLDRLKRLQADFENYKKRVARQQIEHQERAAEALVTQLLPVLDVFDLALAHGSEGLDPVYRAMTDILDAGGLERIDPVGQPFDPNEHDAVQHEPGDGEPEVIEVLRAGYRWKGRVLRAAMVKVKG